MIKCSYYIPKCYTKRLFDFQNIHFWILPVCYFHLMLNGGVCTKNLPNIYGTYILHHNIMGLKVKANTWTWIHFKTFWTSVYISKRFEHLFTFQNVLSHIMCYYVMYITTQWPRQPKWPSPGICISAHMMKLRHIIMMNQKS